MSVIFRDLAANCQIKNSKTFCFRKLVACGFFVLYPGRDSNSYLSMPLFFAVSALFSKRCAGKFTACWAKIKINLIRMICEYPLGAIQQKLHISFIQIVQYCRIVAQPANLQIRSRQRCSVNALKFYGGSVMPQRTGFLRSQ